jgi:xanthine dehydrogenase YagS FAD-binding subunit
MATIGGNIARPHSFNIFPVVLEGLDARVKILSRSGIKTYPFRELYQPDFKPRPGRDCLMLEIIIPAETRTWRCGFEKFAKTRSSWDAYLTLFMAADARAGIIKELRVAVGALSPKPFRALSAEKFLTGKTLSAETIGGAALELERDLDQARAGEFKKEAAAGLFGSFLSGIASVPGARGRGKL